MRNLFEMDLDEDEETGEVILPPGYTGRSKTAYGSLGQATYSVPPQTRPPSETTTSGRLPAGGTVTHLPSQTSACPPCPPCPSFPAPVRSTNGSLIGLVIGLGLVGSVLWYAGKMLTPMGEYEDEDELDSLPSRVPKLSSGEVAENPEEE